jgi:hypothetical protein
MAYIRNLILLSLITLAGCKIASPWKKDFSPCKSKLMDLAHFYNVGWGSTASYENGVSFSFVTITLLGGPDLPSTYDSLVLLGRKAAAVVKSELADPHYFNYIDVVLDINADKDHVATDKTFKYRFKVDSL